MIINTHVHMSRFGVDFSKELGEFYVQMFHGQNCWYTGQPWKPEDFCIPVERLIYDMDRLGIQKTCVLGIAYLTWNSYDPNASDYVQEMVSKYPDRLIGFYTANPLGGLAEVRRFERAVKQQGIRGLKMLPSYNYVALNDRRIWPLYEAAQEFQVPVLIHTGWSSLPKGKMLEYDHPLFLEDVAIDFPDLKLIIGHTGFQWADEAMFFMAKFPNLYSDFAFWAETTPLWKISQVWSQAKMLGIVDRLLWGSDYPYVPFENGLEVFKKVPEYTLAHDLAPVITQDDLDGFFGGNAARLFGLPEATPAGAPMAHC